MTYRKPENFIIHETIGKVLMDNVKDIDVNRNSTKFVFPTFAKIDTSLPQITVKVDAPSFENDSAGDYISEKTLANGDYEVYYYKKALYPVVLYCLTVRDVDYEVIINNDKCFLSNKMLCDFWSHDVITQLRSNRDKLLIDFDNFQIKDKPTSYEASKTRWTAEINCEVQIKSVWVKRYHNGELIKEYTLDKTVN